MIQKVGSGFPKRSCSNNSLKRDDDSIKNHRALAFDLYGRQPGVPPNHGRIARLAMR
jgi:hypothetical protein